ncbi:MAG: hypothetical protein A4E45_01255 [Methanosaeta sp. PtaB.Bin039]|nr:MAG: hypothetical protein A4E45_01255 [Methanosaeta sp. PtaB.Bin039]OPY46227.1 MAG: hypothetical protein A4E47_00661 [Methanosaeta sp. PtaU1.Bin028]HOT07081.1 winged helix-turn-helix domain-containing protein [Methanotrichaceae archaeon]HQF17026.1 winged helix-turn-helix domain-containing protein [Methanotrichaceae archaeon]HQI91646.1 winged helix-turn-helix domain-containing protein [Methanotrichaceae archaeon]
MSLKRDKLDIICEILQRCVDGATKTSIVYKVNLNFRTVNPYLDLLMARGFLEMVPGSVKFYKTSPKGMKLLDELRSINADLKEIAESELVP